PRRLTRELYAGMHFALGQYVGNPVAVEESDVAAFKDVADHAEGFLYFQGTWQVEDEYMRPAAPLDEVEPAYVVLAFRGRAVNVVVRPQGQMQFKVEVRLDGAAVPKPLAGTDISYEDDGRSVIVMTEARLYNVLANMPDERHELRLIPDSSDFNLYTFTFSNNQA
ncbi:MAG: thiol-disulfide isomerase, partial [Dehalococcoidia bacterium]|nr:thiol-disulfide isomerase [Dehalococcoidia bacterium]